MDLSSILAGAKDASRALAALPAGTINAALHSLASLLVERTEEILSANGEDLKRMSAADPKRDRLLLTRERVAAMARDVELIAALPSPLGRTLDERTRPNGLRMLKISVPLGVVGIVYEARPNVTVDAAALCLKSGNAAVLKGGGDAARSNEVIVGIIREALRAHGVDERSVTLLPPDRAAVEALLRARGLVDVIIPRGGSELIKFVREHARVPVIETGAGVVHAYVDRSADIAMAAAIVLNAKTRRPSVCNALDTLIVHRERLADLPAIVAPLAERGVEIFADGDALAVLRGRYDASLLHPAAPEHFGTEFLSLTLAIKTVASLEEALAHIARFGSLHSEAIIATDRAAIETFLGTVDAAVVYANASTCFSDGGEFGMGGEIGISTQKLHARGPMGMEELTSCKWVVRGEGQTRK